MVFSSAIFLFVFLPVVCALYFILPGIKTKNILLIDVYKRQIIMWKVSL